MQWIRHLLNLEPKKYGEFYVYALLDPRFDPPEVFYIGKGSHARVFQHEKDTRTLLKKGTKGAMMSMSCKHKRILAILDSGALGGCTQECIPHEILYRTDEEGDAYRVERQYIEEYGLERLTNETYGLTDAAIERTIARRLRPT